MFLANDLAPYAITNRKRLMQIHIYKRRGFVSSLLKCCRNNIDLMDALDDMGIIAGEEERVRGNRSRHPKSYTSSLME